MTIVRDGEVPPAQVVDSGWDLECRQVTKILWAEDSVSRIFRVLKQYFLDSKVLLQILYHRFQLYNLQSSASAEIRSILSSFVFVSPVVPSTTLAVPHGGVLY